jgi:transposase, IS6 family
MTWMTNSAPTGLKQLRCTKVITTGHAFIQNIRRGHYELGI